MIDADLKYATDFLWKLHMKYEYKQVKKRLNVSTFYDNHPEEKKLSSIKTESIGSQEAPVVQSEIQVID
jgi:hypothetical protein